MGKPVIGIINTWSEMSPCHAHLRDRAEAVKRGVWQAGGYPVELPALSVGEVMVKPYDHALSQLPRHGDGGDSCARTRSTACVLLGGCDKSTPALLMGAISMDLPAIFCPAGPMSNGQWRGTKTGAGTHTKKYWDELRLGKITDGGLGRPRKPDDPFGRHLQHHGHRLDDDLDRRRDGADAAPARPRSRRSTPAIRGMASACGERIVAMVWEDLKPVATS